MLTSSSDDSARFAALTDHLIQFTTALAVIAVASVAAIISYQHAYELVSTHGEHGLTARLLPFTVDGLIWAASMVVLDASRRGQPVPPLAAWSLGVGIVATVVANLVHGPGARTDRRTGECVACGSADRLDRASHDARPFRSPGRRGPSARGRGA